MEWRDEGVLLSMRKHGESAAIIEVFTLAHGRHLGVVRGGASRRMAAMLQPGSQLTVAWRARLEDQLGVFAAEPLQSRAALLADALGLAGLNAVTAMLRIALAERVAHPALWQATVRLLDRVDQAADWPVDYLRWELLLLEDLGFGLDLRQCAVTGSRENLAFVSPRSGRAVSRDAAGVWADRLLPLPVVLLGQGPALERDLRDGLALTGFFLNKGLAPAMNGKSLPEARARLIEMLGRRAQSGLPSI